MFMKRLKYNMNIVIKSQFLILVLIVVLLVSLGEQVEENSSSIASKDWKLIYKNDEKGMPVFGDKEELISIARSGYPIQVGWFSRRRNDTTKTVEHTVNGDFLTIANGSELFVQTQPFFAQRPGLTSDTLSMSLLPIQYHWILGTNGLISSVSTDFTKDTVRAYPPSHFGYELSWFARISIDSD